MKKHKKIKPKNIMAKALSSGIFQQKIIPPKKGKKSKYNRKGFKIPKDLEPFSFYAFAI